MKISKKIISLLGLTVLVVLLFNACEKSDPLPPKVEDLTDQDFKMPTYRLSIEEMDIIIQQREEFMQYKLELSK